MGLLQFLIVFLVIYYSPDRNSVKLSLDIPLAYTYRDSYSQDEQMPIYVNTDKGVNGRVFRLGREVEKTELVFELPEHSQSNLYHYLKGFRWEMTKNLDLSDLKSGYYFLQIKDPEDSNRQFNMPFIVKPQAQVRVALVASTNTWQAYNDYGGLSNYVDSRTEVTCAHALKTYSFEECIFYKIEATIDAKSRFLNRDFTSQQVDGFIPLPWNRPYEILSSEIQRISQPKERHHSHLLRAEWLLAVFLEENSIRYGVFSDYDVLSDPTVFEADLVIFNTHSEYWSPAMMSKLKDFLSSGGKVIFASGNNIYRQVEFDQWGLRVVNQRIDKSLTFNLTGAHYDDRGYDSYSSFTVRDASHWVFDQTGVSNGDRFGEKSWNGSNFFLEGTGASGWETDKFDARFSKGMVLAQGNNESQGGADMVFINFPSGGWLFNASSITFTGSLDDRVIRRMMLNMINNAINGKDSS
jgi:hypothetical protein